MDKGVDFQCVDCKRHLPKEELNIEAVIHHNAKGIRCHDRRICERVKRKKDEAIDIQ